MRILLPHSLHAAAHHLLLNPSISSAPTASSSDTREAFAFTSYFISGRTTQKIQFHFMHYHHAEFEEEKYPIKYGIESAMYLIGNHSFDAMALAFMINAKIVG